MPWNPSPQRWIDGSVDNDLPMTRLAELFNVNHFIVSQVNPHVVPFLVKEEDSIAQDGQQSTSTVAAGPTWLHSLTHLAKGEALHRMHLMAELGIFPNTLTKAVSVLSQKYSGDITIFPEISYADFPRMLSNPTPEFMMQAQLSGERATWPKLSRIKNHCAIELALDDAVQKLRARVVFSPSQVNLRLRIHLKTSSDDSKEAKVKGGRRKRPISQNSAPDGVFDAQLYPAQNNKLSRPKPPNIKESLCIGTSFYEPNYSPCSTDATKYLTIPAALQLPKITQDLTSSGAETSNLTTSSSSSSLSLTSITNSPSPTSPPSPPSHHLFQSASQPATPSHCYHHSSHFPGLSLKSPPLNPLNPAALLSTLSMTPQNPIVAATPTPTPSAPESRYKRLFHHHRSPSSQAMSEPGQAEEGGSGKGSGVTRNWALDLDISGARGLLSRKKKGLL